MGIRLSFSRLWMSEIADAAMILRGDDGCQNGPVLAAVLARPADPGWPVVDHPEMC